jgi:phage regulator Rha-like protein
MGEISQRDFVTDKGNTYQEYILSRDAFMMLAMRFTGDKALQWQFQFVAAFKAMEAKINKADNAIQWKAARLQGKAVRKVTTDTIQEFVEYATAQGSKNARMYYANITKMEYKALDMLEQQKGISNNFRDSLDLPDLCMLLDAENIARMAINHGMAQEWHYKDIYTFAKEKVIARCETAKWATTSIKIENKGKK